MLEKMTVSRAEAKPVVKFRVSRILSLSLFRLNAPPVQPPEPPLLTRVGKEE